MESNLAAPAPGNVEEAFEAGSSKARESDSLAPEKKKQKQKQEQKQKRARAKDQDENAPKNLARKIQHFMANRQFVDEAVVVAESAELDSNVEPPKRGGAGSPATAQPGGFGGSPNSAAHKLFHDEIAQKLKARGVHGTAVEPGAAVFMSAMLQTVLTTFLDDTVARARRQQGGSRPDQAVGVDARPKKVVINPRHIQDAVQYSSNLRALVLGNSRGQRPDTGTSSSELQVNRTNVEVVPVVSRASNSDTKSGSQPPNQPAPSTSELSRSLARASKPMQCIQSNIAIGSSDKTARRGELCGNKGGDTVRTENSPEKAFASRTNVDESPAQPASQVLAVPSGLLAQSKATNSTTLAGQTIIVESLSPLLPAFTRQLANAVRLNAGKRARAVVHDCSADLMLCQQAEENPSSFLLPMYVEALSRTLSVLLSCAAYHSLQASAPASASQDTAGPTLLQLGPTVHLSRALVDARHGKLSQLQWKTLVSYFDQRWLECCRAARSSRGGIQDDNCRRLPLLQSLLKALDAVPVSMVNTLAATATPLAQAIRLSQAQATAVPAQVNIAGDSACAPGLAHNVDLPRNAPGPNAQPPIALAKPKLEHTLPPTKRKRGRPSKQELLQRQKVIAAEEALQRQTRVQLALQRQFHHQIMALVNHQEMERQRRLQQPSVAFAMTVFLFSNDDLSTLTTSQTLDSPDQGCDTVNACSVSGRSPKPTSVKSLDGKSTGDMVLDAFFEILLHRVKANCPLIKVADQGPVDATSPALAASVVVCVEELKEPSDMLEVIALNYNSRQRQLPTCRFEVVRAAHKKQFVSELRGPPQKRSSETAAIVHRDHTSIGSIKASDAGAPCSQQNDERTMLYAFEDDLLMAHTFLLANRHGWLPNLGPAAAGTRAIGAAELQTSSLNENCTPPPEAPATTTVVYIAADLWSPEPTIFISENGEFGGRHPGRHGSVPVGTSEASSMRRRSVLRRLVLRHFSFGHRVVFFGTASHPLNSILTSSRLSEADGFLQR